MEFAEFAARAAEIEAEPADLAIVDHVTDLLTEADGDLAVLARFVQGRVFPAWQSRTLDIGPSYCYEAIARAAGHNVSADDVEDRLAEMGDIGAVAASYEFGGQQSLTSFGSGGGESLTVAEVYDELDALAAVEGQGSQDTKIRILQKLFNRTSPEEARYLARIVLSEMRIGVGEGAVRDAIADAFDGRGRTRPAGVERLRPRGRNRLRRRGRGPRRDGTGGPPPGAGDARPDGHRHRRTGRLGDRRCGVEIRRRQSTIALRRGGSVDPLPEHGGRDRPPAGDRRVRRGARHPAGHNRRRGGRHR
jgi:hypothetical protein